MAPGQSKRKRPELRVIFDTSVVFTGSASDLLRQEVASFVEENAAHTDLDIHCYLPEIVVHERQFQMLTKALELLPAIEKLERVLGDKLAITAERIESRIRETTREQIQRLGLKVQQLDVGLVDWKRLIDDAAYRRPPFEPGEKEKGFRDSLVMETFQQLVDTSPATPRVCRVVLLTGDKLLAEAAERGMAGRLNVRVMRSLEEVKGLISTLIAEVDEKLVAKLQAKATTYFFEKRNEASLYYKVGLQGRIREKISAELAALPPGANRREEGTWIISPPRFTKKEGQRTYWATRITIEAKATKYELKEGFLASSVPSAVLLPGIGLANPLRHPLALF
jgi:hypothetical protein